MEWEGNPCCIKNDYDFAGQVAEIYDRVRNGLERREIIDLLK